MSGFNYKKGSEIILNVYYLGTKKQAENPVFAALGVGLYHSGIEIDGTEYSYGGNADTSSTGVFTMPPLMVDGAEYKESFLIGVEMDKNKIMRVMSEV